MICSRNGERFHEIKDLVSQLGERPGKVGSKSTEDMLARQTLKQQKSKCLKYDRAVLGCDFSEGDDSISVTE